MEYLEGFTLSRLLERSGAVLPARAISILKQICGSLIEAHSIGLIHRDIKPANIMLCTLGGLHDYAKVLDFGMVKDINTQDTNLTAPQALHGTPCYIAPERIEAPTRCDAGTDIYSLGAIAFNLVTGRDVFEGRSAADILVKAVHEAPPPPSSLAPYPVPLELEELILSCLAKDPGGRPQSVAVILESLERIKTDAPWTQKQAREWWQKHAAELQAGDGRP
jgi:serine/threonine-protein kinase